ncbi:MAG: nucleotidyltransferase [Candidatus Kapabacteria bacterium]|nr:nucleotidyltransferase [Candidatus Kapabacteria bacterium]
MVLPAYDELSKMRVDFIFSFTQYEIDAIARANIIQIDGCDVSFCSLEDLIILKIFSGRAIDLEDVKKIINKNPNYNYQLVYNTLKELGEAINIDLISRLKEIE